MAVYGCLRLSEVFHDEPHLTRREALQPLAVVFILATCQPFSGVTLKMSKTIFENFYPCPPVCVRVLEKGCQVAKLPRRSDVFLVEHHLLGGAHYHKESADAACHGSDGEPFPGGCKAMMRKLIDCWLQCLAEK